MIRTICHTRFLAAALSLSMAGGLAADESPLRVGFVYVGPVGDHGWTYRHDIGRRALEQALGDQVDTRFVESVSEGADAERVIRRLASNHDLVFTTSFGFMNPTVKVARNFPDTRFEHATGYKRADNVATYAARFYEGRTIIGHIAGHMTESNIIGYVGSFPIPEVVRGINAFTLAARAVNPDVEVKVVWVNSWYDPGKEGDAAKALIDQGADILVQHTDSPAPLQVAENRGVHGFGQASDMKNFASTAQLTAIVYNWDRYYIERSRAVLDGSWTSQDTWGGLDSGLVDMAPYGEAVPQALRESADQVRQRIIDGDWHPFTGPIRDRDGKERIAEGETASDEMLLGMDWYVAGVTGELSH